MGCEPSAAEYSRSRPPLPGVGLIQHGQDFAQAHVVARGGEHPKARPTGKRTALIMEFQESDRPTSCGITQPLIQLRMRNQNKPKHHRHITRTSAKHCPNIAKASLTHHQHISKTSSKYSRICSLGQTFRGGPGRREG